jgi:hypothetical protein
MLNGFISYRESLTISQLQNYDQCFLAIEAPKDFAVPVNAWRDNHFIGRCIGRRRPTEWTPPRPDRTACHLSSWCWTEHGYGSKSRTLGTLKQKIRGTFDSASLDFLQKSDESLPYKLHNNGQNCGARFEV